MLETPTDLQRRADDLLLIAGELADPRAVEWVRERASDLLRRARTLSLQPAPAGPAHGADAR